MELKEIGNISNQIEDDIGLTLDDVLNKLTQELGEFNDAIQKYRGRYSKTKSMSLGDTRGEVGDLFFNVISICNRIGIDPNELPNLAENTLKKFMERKELYRKNISNS